MNTAMEMITEAASFARTPDSTFLGEHRTAEDAALSALRKVKEGLDEAKSIVVRYQNQIPPYGVLVAKIVVDHCESALRDSDEGDEQ